MIKGSDLMLGNYIIADGEVRKVLAVDMTVEHGKSIGIVKYDNVISGHKIGYTSKWIDQIQPIELSPALLVKCGFVKRLKPVWTKQFNDIGHVFTINVIDGEYWLNVGDCKLDSLHKLQNAYYTYTGHELKVEL